MGGARRAPGASSRDARPRRRPARPVRARRHDSGRRGARGAAPAAPDPFAWARPAAAQLGRAGLWSPAPAQLGRDATRRDLARLTAHLGETTTSEPLPALADVARGDPDWVALADAARRGLLSAPHGRVRPDDPVTAREADQAFVRLLPLEAERRGLASLPYRLPAGFPSEVLAAELGLRHNLPAADDALERGPEQPARVADLIRMAARTMGLLAHPGLLGRVAALRAPAVRPPADPVRRAELQRALRQVGEPYVWGGEWPTPASPVDPQAAGGFDCSGLAWFALRDTGRATADEMAWTRGWPRIAPRYLRPGDLVFFGPRGRRSRPGTVTHMALYLGGGLMVQSSGSRAGVSVSRMATYWPGGLAWGRRPAGAAGTGLPVPAPA